VNGSSKSWKRQNKTSGNGWTTHNTRQSLSTMRGQLTRYGTGSAN
jgi:hypothetical protein